MLKKKKKKLGQYIPEREREGKDKVRRLRKETEQLF